MNNNDISLVIATYNSAEMLEKSLKENIKIGFAAIIIVDGESTDQTEKVVKSFQLKYPSLLKFYITPRRGLANARNYGASKVKTVFTMHAGPDNILSSHTVTMIREKVDTYDLVSCQTRRLNTSNYLGKAHNIYKRRYTPGLQPVVGTPYLGRTSLFCKFPFNEKMLNSDDTELCQRLTDAGKSIFRSPEICLEIGFEKIPDIIERWMRWGRGDALFYRSQRLRWTLCRKIRSWLHPTKAEIFDCLCVLPLYQFLYILPFLLFVTTLRYMGWLRFVLLQRK